MVANNDPVPTITYNSMDWLVHHIDPSMRVFEWGSGFSTIYFAMRVAEVVSVEHVEKWHRKAVEVLEARQLSNCTVHLRLPEPLPPGKHTRGPGSYLSYKSTKCSFESYVKTIGSYPDNHFDFIFVDGRARSSCILHAIPKLRPGGYLMLDNSERSQYQGAVALMKGWDYCSFYGNGPTTGSKWATTIWLKPI